MHAHPANPSATGPIIVAIKFDAHAAGLVAASLALAKASQRPLTLVHVCDPRPANNGGLIANASGETPEVHRQLRDLVPSHAERCVVTHTQILDGFFPEALVDYAAVQKASLIIAGASVRDPGPFKTKLKQTYKLMDNDSVPVLVLPDAYGALSLGERPLRLLIADDLTPTSLHAIHAADALIDLLRIPADVLHIHVEAPQAVSMGLSDIHELEVWPGISVKERLINDRHEHLKQRLRVRANALRQKVRSVGGTYTTQLWHGSVRKEISRAVEQHASDISIFGRHQFFHRQTVSLGQMKFAAMLDVGSAILVAP